MPATCYGRPSLCACALGQCTLHASERSRSPVNKAGSSALVSVDFMHHANPARCDLYGWTWLLCAPGVHEVRAGAHRPAVQVV